VLYITLSYHLDDYCRIVLFSSKSEAFIATN
jgi:hypothetical protein